MKKALPLLAILGGVLLIGSQSSTKSSNYKGTYKNLNESAKIANEEAILKYYSPELVYIKDIEPIMSVLTPSLQQNVIEDGNSIMIPIDRAIFFYEGAELIISEKYKGIKGLINDPKKIDAITKDVLTRFANDVYWKEGLIPYSPGSPFQLVWTSVNRLVELAAMNREEKGI